MEAKEKRKKIKLSMICGSFFASAFEHLKQYKRNDYAQKEGARANNYCHFPVSIGYGKESKRYA